MMSALAFSQPPLPDGTWSTLGVWKNGSGTVVSILALDPAAGIYAASGFWASGPQTDSLVGMAKLEGTVLTIIPTNDGDDPEDTKKSCKIVMRFSADFKMATIRSSECAMRQHPVFEGQTIVLNKKQE